MLTKPCGVDNSIRYVWHNTFSEGVRQPSSYRIMVIGVNKAGNNTVTRFMEMGTIGAECIAVNLDAAHLAGSKADRKILLYEEPAKIRKGYCDKNTKKVTIEESRGYFDDLLSNVEVVFVTADLSGKTEADVARAIAEAARQKGAITISVVTIPSQIEKGLNAYVFQTLYEMQKHCDTVVAIDNNRLSQLAPQLSINEAFMVADQVLANIIRGVIEAISSPSLINLDFADFRAIVRQGGLAVVGVGESDSPNRAEEAVRNALTNPLLNVDCGGATGALIQVTGDNQMTVEEANRVGEIVTEMMDNNALVIWGARVNPELDGKLKVTLVMTGLNSPHILSGLGLTTPQLFNLEPHAEPERALYIKLDLYQMENF